MPWRSRLTSRECEIFTSGGRAAFGLRSGRFGRFLGPFRPRFPRMPTILAVPLWPAKCQAGPGELQSHNALTGGCV